MSKKKIRHIIELLKLVLTLDDEEMVKVTIESIIEIMEEEITSKLL